MKLLEKFWRTKISEHFDGLNTLLNIFSFIGLNAMLMEKVKAWFKHNILVARQNGSTHLSFAVAVILTDSKPIHTYYYTYQCTISIVLDYSIPLQRPLEAPPHVCLDFCRFESLKIAESLSEYCRFGASGRSVDLKVYPPIVDFGGLMRQLSQVICQMWHAFFFLTCDLECHILAGVTWCHNSDEWQGLSDFADLRPKRWDFEPISKCFARQTYREASGGLPTIGWCMSVQL